MTKKKFARRHWLTIVSGRGDKANERVNSAFDILKEQYGPFKKVKSGTLGSYDEAGGFKEVYKGKSGIIIDRAFDRAGFSSISVLEGSVPAKELKAVLIEPREILGLKGPYRDRSPNTWRNPDSDDYFN